MPVDVQIEGTSYIAGARPGQWMVEESSVSIELDIAAQQPRAEFDVVVWNQAITRPKAGQEAVFYAADGSREFGGIIMDIAETEEQPTIMRYHCTCGDYTHWFDRHLVFGTFQSQDADALVRTIVSSYANIGGTRTFTTNNVQPAYPVPLMQFVYLPPSQVMAQLTQMLGWGWFIDSYRDVHFYDTQTFQSPLPGNLLNADDLYDDPALAASAYPNWVNLEIDEDVSQIKTRCYITGIYIASTQQFQQTFIGDGATTVFSMAYQAPSDVSKIVVTVGGVAQQIALDWIDGTPGGSYAAQTAYVDFTQQTIRFGTPPASGVNVVATYYPMQQTAVMRENAAAQRFMAARDATDGIYEYNRMDPSLSAELPSLAYERANMTLTKYAYPYLTLKFTSFLQGWYPGQFFYFSSARRFDGEMNVANDTQRAFYVLSVSKKLVQAVGGAWTWVYTITAASTPFEI